MVNPLACSLGNDNDNLCGNIVSICHSKNATFWCVNNSEYYEKIEFWTNSYFLGSAGSNTTEIVKEYIQNQ